MKTLNIAVLLLIPFVNPFSYAQQTGPSKEVTVQAINKYMNEAVGMKRYNLGQDDNGNYSKRHAEVTIKENTFSMDNIRRYTAIKYTDGSKYNGEYYHETIEHTLMSWGNFTNISVDSTEEMGRDKELVVIFLKFSSKILENRFCTQGSINVGCGHSSYNNGLVIYIPRNRVEACYKALIHLKELCAVKDPFED